MGAEMPDLPGSTSGAYDRGHLAGEIAARLTNHDKHFSTINGSLERIAQELTVLRLAVQQQNDRSVADRDTAVALAQALREASARSWSPWAKFFTILGVVVMIVATVAAVLQLRTG
jgi:hypothetical protein